ncbi:MAG TPA: hypothetical protein VFG20_15260 [Planctomycetaceae bacterium]|jgi:hypothetical protein|nr:hypothetical protein [Planctomycetaceae bacterium]
MIRHHRPRWLLITVVITACPPLLADEPPAFPALPFGGAPIDYWDVSDDAVQRLKRRIEAGKVHLRNDSRYGLLPAVLSALQIDPSTQVLKFASGSPHREIGVNRPRAIYFRDDVAVAWHPGTPHIEIAAQSRRRGTVFYTLTATDDGPPRFERPQRCLACHSGPKTGTNVPGWQLHSGLSPVDAGASPWQTLTAPSLSFDERWRAVYIRGKDIASSRSLTDDLPFVRHAEYPSVSGDPAALLVRDHWLLGMNLLTRWSYEHQLQQPREETIAAVVRYLLMRDETPLPQPLPKDTAFARWWQNQGPSDPHGRSLRDLDLESRTFRYAVSPLILTAMVQEQPVAMRRELYRRIRVELPAPLREETLSILRATVSDWPTE